jgi:DNA-binding response OmpR family regulator
MSHRFTERRPLVMLVEDDLTIGQNYRLGLEVSGLRVLVLTNESAFFRAVDLETPDAVVLDVQMKGVLSCADIVDNFRLDESSAGIPVLVLTNDLIALDGQIDRLLEAGALTCLVRSQADRDQLAARVYAALGSPAVANRSLSRPPGLSTASAKRAAAKSSQRPIKGDPVPAPGYGTGAVTERV